MPLRAGILQPLTIAGVHHWQLSGKPIATILGSGDVLSLTATAKGESSDLWEESSGLSWQIRSWLAKTHLLHQPNPGKAKLK